MSDRYERRHEWRRVIGVERRGAPIPTLEGHPLPDPTRLIDEEFEPELVGTDPLLAEGPEEGH